MAGDLTLFKSAAFLGSLLLFLLELLAAKALLPLFGGGAGVWTTALMFFQGLLFVGYAYGLRAAESPRLHLLAAAAALAWSWAQPAAAPAGTPFVRLLLALLAKTGPPFLVLAATTPVIQEWLRLRGCSDPAFLFSYSNAGAFAALFAYPILVEPNIPLEWQARLLAAGFGAYAVLLAACAPGTAKREEPRSRAEPAGRGDVILWLPLSLGPNAALLCAANLLGMDLAAVPLVWVLPLAVYLATLVLAFRSRPWFPDRPAGLLIGGGLVILVGTAFGLEALRHGPEPWFAQRHFLLVSKSVLILAGLFAVCLACHGSLAESRPEAARLPRFYLWVALGGWLGGLLVSVIVPALGRDVASPNVEALVALAFCAAGLWRRERSASGLRRWRWAAVLAGLACCGAYAAGPSAALLFRMRDFYGFYRVTSARGWRILFHGRTIHGVQSLDPAGARQPVAYYHPHSPIGEVFSEFGPRAARVAVVGLGAGACAAFGRRGQEFDFYELDPALEAVARKFFTYLDESPARVSVIPGDARLSLAEG
ncbi:MAG: hypothetical protein PHU21_06190, partial [Elusimicrobia bacterium]|nr:hypothetical protein [Elusimicrobiota bacterium]